MSKRIGALWKPKKADSQATMNGILDVMGIPVRISIFKNKDDKQKANSPAYHIVSFGIEESNTQSDSGKLDNTPPHTDDDFPG